MVVSRTDIRYSKVTFIVNLRALYVVTFQHNQMIAENRILGVGPIVLILSWDIRGNARRRGSLVTKIFVFKMATNSLPQ